MQNCCLKADCYFQNEHSTISFSFAPETLPRCTLHFILDPQFIYCIGNTFTLKQPRKPYGCPASAAVSKMCENLETEFCAS